jgi:hypothetical protein
LQCAVHVRGVCAVLSIIHCGPQRQTLLLGCAVLYRRCATCSARCRATPTSSWQP